MERPSLDGLPSELVHMISRSLDSRNDLLSLSLTSRRYLRITNNHVTFCATAAGKDQLRVVATALDWSQRVRHRMATLVLSDAPPNPEPPPPPGGEEVVESSSMARTQSTSTSNTMSSTASGSSESDSKEASTLMLTIITRAKHVRDIQITGYCLDLLLLSNHLTSRKRLARFAFNPNPPSSAVDPALLPLQPTHFEYPKVIDLLQSVSTLRKLHVRNLRSGVSSTTSGQPSSPRRRRSKSPAKEAEEAQPPRPTAHVQLPAKLVVLDLNRPLIVDTELIELFHAHAETLDDVCVVFHEASNALTPLGVQEALRPCSKRLSSLHLGFNRSTRFPIEDVLPGDLHFPRLQNVATCGIIMPSLRRFAQFPNLRVLRTNSLVLRWLRELQELAAENAIPPSLVAIGVIHRPTVPAEGEEIAQLCTEKGIELRYWAPEAAAQSLL